MIILTYTYILLTMVQLIIELTPEIHKKFKQVAVANGEPMSKIIRRGIEDYITEKTKPVIY